MAQQVTIDGVVSDVDISALKPWPDNPRVGDVGAIMDSLEALGQFRPVLIRPDMTILAGHHVVQAAQNLGWEIIQAVTVDADDETAAKIVLADNRLADMGTYDLDALVDSLTAMDDLAGTGYDENDLAALVGSLANEVLPPVDMSPTGAHSQSDSQGMDPLMPGQADQADHDHGDEDLPLQPDGGLPGDEASQGYGEDVHDNELTGFVVPDQVRRLDPDVMFKSQAKWHIPELRDDMVVETLPELVTWASAKVTPPRDDEHYLYNYAVDSATGLPWDRSLVGFYTQDRYFEGWWDAPDYYVGRLAASGAIGAITPNYSVWEWPDAMSLFNIYRSRWVARFMQEAGVKVIPDIQVTYTGHAVLSEAAVAGVPTGLPWVAIQLQSADNQDAPRHAEMLAEIIDHLSPDNVLVYGGQYASEVIEVLNPMVKADIRWQTNRYMARHGTLYNRDPE